MSERVEATIDAAIARMRERGWAQEDFEDEHDRLCLRGALKSAAGLMPSMEYSYVPDDALNNDALGIRRSLAAYAAAGDVVKRACVALYGEPPFGDVPTDPIVFTNDRLLTTEDEAIEVLEKARAIAGEEGV